MDDESVAATNYIDQGVWTVVAILVYITPLVQVVIHSIAAMYVHMCRKSERLILRLNLHLGDGISDSPIRKEPAH